MDVTEDGIVILLNDEHPEQAQSAIILMNDGITNEFAVGLDHKRVSYVSLDESLL